MEKRGKVIDPNLIKLLSSLGCKILKNEPLSRHCSFKIGGPAGFFVEIPSKEALNCFLGSASTCNYIVLGGGTNILFSDEGYRGIIISLVGKFKEISVLGEKIISGGGALLSNVVNTALKNNLTGLECVAGIPGTVGGAIYGNAGNKYQWISEAVGGVEVYKNLDEEFINKEKIVFGYRKSGLKNCIITNVSFFLRRNTDNDSLSTISKSIQKRLGTQPLNIPNAGSIFKNPAEFSVGKLVEESGLKGICIGGAKISELHGNFIVNCGDASAKDVLALIDLIKNKVKEKFSIDLETEIKIIK
ncbi:UDP-N-acetylenolpyruvoylglucosamine reductase [Endomicrobiia bacterium]|nr:UDP-N-acetylenolpyruvoylglucosamine reductase [Endomicrobiia bacterium]